MILLTPAARSRAGRGSDEAYPRTHLVLSGVGILSVAITALPACGDEQVLTTTRNLERPGPAALICTGTADEDGVPAVLPLNRCTPEEGDPSANGTQLFGFVANTARGDIALFQAVQNREPLVDLDPASPGFGFIPVGSLPSDMEATRDGCRVYTANSGSCDLSVLDAPGILQQAAGARSSAGGSLVGRIVPRTAAGPLNARPQALIIAPDQPTDGSASGDGGISAGADAGADASTDATCRHRRRRAYVSFPRCNLVAELDLDTGLVLRGLIFEPGGVRATSAPDCPTECRPVRLPPLADGAVTDSGVDSAVDSIADTLVADARPNASDASVTPDAADGAVDDGGVDASPDAGTSDASSADAATTDAPPATPDGSAGEVVPAGVLPFDLVLDDSEVTARRLYVSSAGANYVTQIQLLADGSLDAAGSRRIVLEGSQATTTRLSLSPILQSELAPFGRFLYAVAGDRSVRVIATATTQECDTNVDLALLPPQVPLTEAGCFPVGQRPRRVSARGPGFTFGRLVPRDVTFIQPRGEPELANAEKSSKFPARPLLGTYALIAVSDGTIFAVDIEDTNELQGATTLARQNLPHRFRNLRRDGDPPSIALSSLIGAGEGGVPAVVKRLATDVTDDATAVCRLPKDEEAANPPTQCARVRSIGEPLDGELDLVYEGRLIERDAGQLRLDRGGSQLVLADRGVDFCESGVEAARSEQGRNVQAGDIVVLVGCRDDRDCGEQQVCRKPIARRSESGLCLEEKEQDALFQQCRTFLQQPREFRVARAERGRLVLSALPVEPQTLLRQQGQTSPCCDAAGCENTRCADGFFCVHSDRSAPSAPGLTVSRGECVRPGCDSARDCASGACVKPLDGSPRHCAPLSVAGTGADRIGVPMQVVAGVCNGDSCTPNDPGLQQDGASWSCANFPALKGRCVRPSRCFERLIRYEVRAGRSFLAPALHRRIADPATGECIDDDGQSPLLETRIPIGVPVHPILAGPRCSDDVFDPNRLPSPNACIGHGDLGYVGVVNKSGSVEDTVTETPTPTAPTVLVRYTNPSIDLMLGLSHLQRPAAVATRSDAGVDTPDGGVVEDAGAAPTGVSPPMPERGLTLRLSAQSGFEALRVANSTSNLALPGQIVAGPDQKVYVIDMGDRSGGSGANGQVLRIDAAELTFDPFVAR